jgi:hypothetical protein
MHSGISTTFIQHRKIFSIQKTLAISMGKKDLRMYDGVFDNGVAGEGEACWYSRVEENSLDPL